MLAGALSDALRALDLRGRHLLVAVSGGVDSIALLHALHAVSEQEQLKLTTAHVNHGLRGAESDADQALVEAACRHLGIACEVAAVAPEALRADGSSRTRPTLQEAARTLRYEALEGARARVGAEVIVTAHHLDDQAETVLLRLFRGTGPDGLQGIPERSPDGRIARPLLGVSRDEIERFARQHRLTWREDASNRSPAYARTRVRALLPELAEQFNPQILRAIADLAEALRRDGEWIRASVEREIAARFEHREDGLAIDAKDWRALAEPLARRVARAALMAMGGGRDVSRVHLERMCRFLADAEPGKRIELPGPLLLERRREGYRLTPGAASDPRDAC